MAETLRTDQPADTTQEQPRTGREPVDKFQDGPVQVSIFQNPSSKGDFRTATLEARYKDKDGQFQTSHSYTASVSFALRATCWPFWKSFRLDLTQFGALCPPSDQLAVRLRMDHLLASAIKAQSGCQGTKSRKGTPDTEESQQSGGTEISCSTEGEKTLEKQAPACSQI